MRTSAAWTDLALTPGLTARVRDEPMVPTCSAMRMLLRTAELGRLLVRGTRNRGEPYGGTELVSHPSAGCQEAKTGFLPDWFPVASKGSKVWGTWRCHR